jgi:thiol-disulfide isomerase/thioredoxin
LTFISYVDDSTVSHYIENPRAVSFLYVYSHTYVCIKCAAAANLVSRLAKDFNGQANVLSIDAADSYSKKTMERLGIQLTTEEFPVLIEFPFERSNGVKNPHYRCRVRLPQEACN